MMDESLNNVFAALADPTRRALLARLAHGATVVSDLAKPFLDVMSLPAITKHLKVLEKAGLITKSKQAQWRTCQINADKLAEASAWIDTYRVMWSDSFDRLEQYMDEISSVSESSPLPKNSKK